MSMYLLVVVVSGICQDSGLEILGWIFRKDMYVLYVGLLDLPLEKVEIPFRFSHGILVIRARLVRSRNLETFFGRRVQRRVLIIYG
jgi:hypothetical protein